LTGQHITGMNNHYKEGIKLKSLADVEIIELQTIPDDTGELVIMESGDGLGMSIERVFVVSDTKGTTRGCHAHKECAQILICLNGTCKVLCDDGENRKSFELKKSNQGLFLPPTIWAEQRFTEDQTNLLVLCDHFYDESDYIRDYEVFKNFRKTRGKQVPIK